MLILHYTGMTSAAAALDRLCDPAARVSAHYVIDEDGSVFRLVDESRRAWHAGVSHWAGRDGLNDVSIGIELVNPGHEHGYRGFPEAQMRACIALCREILDRWPIPPGRVLAHSDVAPLRKDDPGELFDWERLARAGIGLWPGEAETEAEPPDEAGLRAALARFGYGLTSSAADPALLSVVVRAFQRHFAPDCLGGPFDGRCWARLERLLTDAGRDLPRRTASA